jgi:hypothetical protein
VTRITGTLHEDVYTFIMSRWILRRMRNVSDKSVEKTCVCWSIIFISKIVLERDGKVRQATDDNIVCHALWMLDNYKYILGICNTYCFSTATVVTQRRLSFMLHVHTLLVLFRIFLVQQGLHQGIYIIRVFPCEINIVCIRSYSIGYWNFRTFSI